MRDTDCVEREWQYDRGQNVEWQFGHDPHNSEYQLLRQAGKTVTASAITVGARITLWGRITAMGASPPQALTLVDSVLQNTSD